MVVPVFGVQGLECRGFRVLGAGMFFFEFEGCVGFKMWGFCGGQEGWVSV